MVYGDGQEPLGRSPKRKGKDKILDDGIELFIDLVHILVKIGFLENKEIDFEFEQETFQDRVLNWSRNMS